MATEALATRATGGRPGAGTRRAGSDTRRGAGRSAGRGGTPRLRDRPWYPMARRIVTVAFLGAVLALVFHHARSVEWGSVWASIRAYPAGTLGLAALLAAVSHALYCSYDLIGRHETGHRLPARQVVGVGFTCYAFNLNLGSLVGGVALRYRLYARLGLPVATITRVLALSLVTNWLGYLAVAGSVFLFAGLTLPPGWELGSEGLRWLGGALLVAAAAYVGLCVFSPRRAWRVRGHEVKLPSGRLAAMQLAVSAFNWMTIAAIVWVLLRHHVDYPTVLGVLLIAAVAGVIAHVPAGLGVLEGVFIALLAHRIPQHELIAGLLAYRGFYYLLPLALALGVYLSLEAAAKKGRRTKAVDAKT